MRMELRTSAGELEEALEDSENRFRCLVEYASDGYLLYDEEGRLLDVNTSACEAYGYSREELVDITLAELTDVDEALCGGGARTVSVYRAARTPSARGAAVAPLSGSARRRSGPGSGGRAPRPGGPS